MIILDYKDTRPIYEQICEKFKVLILKGVLVPDEQMPSVRNLAMELSINPNTIQRAYAELERENFIYTVKGRGNFVADTQKLLAQKREICMKNLQAQIEEAMEYGITREEILSILNNEFEIERKDI